MRVETTRKSRALAALRRRVDLWLQWSPDRWKRAFTFNIRFQKNIFGRMPHARRHDRGEILHRSGQRNVNAAPLERARERRSSVRRRSRAVRAVNRGDEVSSEVRSGGAARLFSADGTHPRVLRFSRLFLPGRAGTRDPGLELSLTVSLRSNRRRRRDMTFQIFVGGQRVNSADVLNTPAWSHQVRLSPPVTSHAHACSKKRGGCFCRL